MFDTYLTDQQVETLASELRDFAQWRAELGRISRRETSPPGGRATRNPNGYGSTPPVNLQALHLCRDVDLELGRWARALRAGARVEWPDDDSPSGLARFLARQCGVLATRPVALEVWDRVVGYRDQNDRWHTGLHEYVQRVVEPPEPSIADRHSLTPLEAKARSGEAMGTAKDMVIVHFAVTGQDLKEATIRSWRCREKLPDRRGPGGQAWYWYSEVAAVAAEMAAERGEKRKKNVARGLPGAT